MVGFELGKQVEKGVFRLVSSVGRKNSESPWGIKPQTPGFRASTLYHWATETLRWASSIMKFIWHASCILLGWTTSMASCYRSNCRSIIEQLLFRLHVLFCRSNNYQVNDTVDLRGLLLLSLPIKTSPVYITLEAITEIHFERRNSLTRSFRLISWESSDQITRQ